MIIEYSLLSQRTVPGALLSVSLPPPEQQSPRIARILALAHKLDAVFTESKSKKLRDIAKARGVTPTRLSQILVLLALAPDIQERVLFFSVAEARFVNEAQLRKIARQPLWDRQRALFAELIAR